ncbi:hypothetical protein AB6869_21840 [Rahnella rivi]|uniref:hypothetical protein n=1 Tax=Rahnella rivi TaxID=2816249 RepID=UPI0039BEB199
MNIQDEFFKLWHALDSDQKTAAEAENIADQTWKQGLRLSKYEHRHYHEVKHLLLHSFRPARWPLKLR